jgi:hypothetical protein
MKLKHALREWDSLDMDEGMEPEATLVSWARRVANPDLEASGQRLWRLMNPRGKDWNDLRPGTRIAYEQQALMLINAALGEDAAAFGEDADG